MVLANPFKGMEKKWSPRENSQTMLNPFWNFHDPAELCLNGVKVGSGQSERIGRVIHLVSLHFKYTYNDPSIPDNIELDFMKDQSFRIIVFLDKQCNGAPVSSTAEVVENFSSERRQFYNLENTTRFQILYDKTHVMKPFWVTGLNGVGTHIYSKSNTNMDVKSFNKYWKNGLKILFTGDAEDVASISDKAIHVMATGTNPFGVLAWSSRIRYFG